MQKANEQEFILNPSKKHHFVPQKYQLLFSHDGEKLYYLNKKNMRIHGPSNAKPYCFENHLYNLTGKAKQLADESEERIDSIEQPFLYKIDTNFMKEMDKILSNPDKRDVSYYNLSLFIGYLIMRHPKTIRDSVSSINQALIDLAVNSEEGKLKAKELEINTNNKKAFEDVTFSDARNLALLEMIKQAEIEAKTIFQMRWVFIYNTYHKNFLLSDNPVILNQKEPIKVKGLILESDQCHGLVPLSKEVCVALCFHRNEDAAGLVENKIIEYDQISQAHEINNLTVENANTFIIGADKSQLETTSESSSN